MPWIKYDKRLPRKPEVIAIAADLSLDKHAVVGKLLEIWGWFDEESEGGNAPSVTPASLTSHIDGLAGVTGFAAAMRKVGWLNGTSIPNFDRHLGEGAKKRALTSRRQERFRNASVTQTVTHGALPEQNRTEHIKSTPTASSDLSLSADVVEKSTVERIPLNDGTEWPVMESFRAELDRLFPAVDPSQTLREIRAWCLGNPTRRKTRSGVKRFIVSWFSREQDRHSKGAA